MTDADGIVTRYEYDGLGRLTAVIENYRPGEPSDHQTNVRTEYGYDGVGNRVVITDANGHATRYTYDALNQLKVEIDPLGYTTQYGYDRVRSRTVMTDADGGVTRYVYDGLDRLVRVEYPDGVVEYGYDRVGNRVVMTDSTGTTRYIYDALYRPITITLPTTGVVSYRYDSVGNRTRLIYPFGGQVDYTYDAANRLATVSSPNRPDNWTIYTYDAAGRLVQLRDADNSAVSTYTYDGAGRLISLVHTDGNGVPVAGFEYTLDGVGNRIRTVETILGQMVAIDYEYDGLYRLTGAHHSTGEVFRYDYDPVGNRLVMTDPLGVHLYAYDAADRLVS
ncbi:MAG TPA: RHS repeat protein, partial [Anaerolineae bacterium]|nr:RHS repeat protein [Anaerolineae bacterium]